MANLIKISNEDSMRNIMGTILRVGVLSAAFIVVFGGLLFFFQHKGEFTDYTAFKEEPARLREMFPIIRDALNLKSKAVIQMGLLILIATPVVRVLFSLIGFLIEKDWIYIVITFIVLMILLMSLFGSFFVF
jgi:uncharacterized membrane protein